METHTRRKIKEKGFTPFESPVSVACDNEVTPSPYVYNSQTGFTLIELMVSLTVFSIVMVISVGTLLTLIDANAKAQALYMATTNLSFALDAITRDIRTGHEYHCYNGGGIPAGGPFDCLSGDSLSFIRDWDSVQVGYRLNGGKIQQNVGMVSSGSWEDMTSDKVVINSLSFVVKNSESLVSDNDMSQPTIDVVVSGYVDNGLETTTDFNLQTHIVARRLDIL
ncbi:MAG: prepilin-type N-terminal cleavage/methylation domain-containing protein [Candidatus Kaiserbacteria bacterium]|nr:prepilin-type N-terminal cleavage/methylation domain-containing protein [Candidatus Kaiserbacteria bacterium]